MTNRHDDSTEDELHLYIGVGTSMAIGAAAILWFDVTNVPLLAAVVAIGAFVIGDTAKLVIGCVR